MAGYKETPRQKMIAMMYLVLTSMLALNVSKEIIDAFIVVNESMEVTNSTFTTKIDNTYDKFRQQLLINENKVRPFWEQAEEVRSYTTEMVNYIDSIKYAVLITTDGDIENVEQAKAAKLESVKAKDRYTEPTRFFFGRSPDGTNGVSGELKRKLDSYRGNMLTYMGLDPNDDRLGLVTSGDYRDADGQKQNWMQHNFYYTILAADVTILNKLIAEVKNAEFDVVTYLYNAVTAEDFKFDVIDAKVIPKSNYIFEGDEYEAEVIVAAYDTKQSPDVFYLEGADSITQRNLRLAKEVEGKKGVVRLSIPAGSSGQKKYAGMIRVVTPAGDTNNYYFKDEYTVSKPSLTVSATKMNVFYIGVDNPVSISVPGISSELIKPNISIGSLTPDEGIDNWMVRIPERTASMATITVDANFESGTKRMGQAEFRVKRVPNPQSYIANVSDGPVSKNALIAAGAIIPRMPEDFDFELNFVITSFTFTSVRAGDIFEWKGTGNILSEDMKNFVRSAKRGTKIWLEDIIAKGPDGSRKLSTISLVLQ